ncbi:MAG TPA: RecQ family ATP-dependent DNA helicase, partial [Herpetosiphonaceae bacterium]
MTQPDLASPSAAEPPTGPPDESGHELPQSLTEALEAHFGLPGFRGGQQAVIERVMAGQSTLALMPTGAGKSLCYQLPALLLPHATVVISPLIALMKDQLDGLPPAVRRRSTLINSSISHQDVQMRLRDIAAGRFKLVYVAPERLRNRQFLHALQQAAISLFVVDEAHCVSLWGMSFRPDYLFIGEALRQLGRPPVLALTATATPTTEREIGAQLGALEVVRTNVFRPNLSFEVVKVASNDAKHAQVVGLCKKLDGAIIVYVRSRAGCEEMAAALKREGIAAESYHAQREDRDAIQERFMRGETRVIAATVAFGMGVDKPDIRAVIHHNLPQSLEAYAQEAGRAGRDGQPARCILMYMPTDKQQLTTWLQRDAFSRDELRDVFKALRRIIRSGQDLLAIADVSAATGLEETRLRVALGMLERVGLIRRHFDLPRTASLRLPASENPWDEPPPDELGRRLELSQRGVDWPIHELAHELDQPLSGVEAELLALAGAGRLHYDGYGREMLVEILDYPPDIAERIDGVLQEYGAAQELRIQSLIDYARSTNCRHRELAAHFGQRLSPCGDACDNCKSGRRPSAAPPSIRRQGHLPISPRISQELPDHHRMIIDAVRANPAAWGSRDLAHMLVGSQGFAHAEIFGAMAHRSFESVQAEIDVLVEAGHLAYRGATLIPVERPAASASAAQTILQALGRLPFAMGRSGLAKVLKGASSASIGPERSPDYGVLGHFTIDEIERQVETLVQEGLVERDTQQKFPVLRMTAKGRQALADPARLAPLLPAARP